jgi:hypothetical protein
MTEYDAELCLGYFCLERPGDLAYSEVDCLECGQPCETGIWFAIMGDGTLVGPLCELCATSE